MLFNSYTFNSNIQIEKFIPIIDSKIEFFFKNYLSFNSLKFSIVNIKRSLMNTRGHRSYSRMNIVKSDKVNEEKVINLAEKRSEKYYNNFKINKKEYFQYFKNLKTSNLDASFVVFIPPLSQPFLDKIVNNKILFKYYFLWIEELIEVFGEVRTFSIKSEYTINYQKYSIDGDHFYPIIGNKILKIISKSKNNDYSEVLNKSNIKKFKYKLGNL